MTTLVQEVRIPKAMTRNDGGNTSQPDPLEITYTQVLMYTRKGDTDAGLVYIEISDIFTIPFQQDGGTYTKNLRAITNNTRIIFLENVGEAKYQTTTLSPKAKHNLNVLVVVMSVVASSTIIASAYIIYLTRVKDHDNDSVPLGRPGAGDDPPIVGAIIGVTPNENILVSESYDDDYLENSFVNEDARPDRQVVSGPSEARNEDSFPDGPLSPPVETRPQTELFGTFPTLPTAPSTAVIDEENGEYSDQYLSHSPVHSFRSSSMGSDNDPGFSPPSPLLLGDQEHDYLNGEAAPDDDSLEESNVPFMSGFQLEIQDLE